MKLSEMRELLATRGIHLTKSLGQNFLHDGNQLRRIVKAAELTQRDKVLEIGPGLGPLTELLLENAGEVLAIEKDARLVEFLREQFKISEGRITQVPNSANAKDQGLAKLAPPKFTLLHDDALEFLKREPRDWHDWKLVANLPYSVASPILVELAQTSQRPKRMVATLQLEVAWRLMARAADEDYGVLTLLVAEFLKSARHHEGVHARVTRQFLAVQEYIHWHMREAIRLGDLARVVALHPTYFSDQFKRVVGVRPLDYLVRRRIERAQYLLLTTEDSVKSIADAVGIADPAYFSRVFTRLCGASPSAYRSSHSA